MVGLCARLIFRFPSSRLGTFLVTKPLLCPKPGKLQGHLTFAKQEIGNEPIIDSFYYPWHELSESLWGEEIV